MSVSEVVTFDSDSECASVHPDPELAEWPDLVMASPSEHQDDDGDWDIVSSVGSVASVNSIMTNEKSYKSALLAKLPVVQNATPSEVGTGKTVPNNYSVPFVSSHGKSSAESEEQLLTTPDWEKPLKDKLLNKHDQPGRRQILKGHTGRRRDGFLRGSAVDGMYIASPLRTSVEEHLGYSPRSLNHKRTWEDLPAILEAESRTPPRIITEKSRFNGGFCKATVYQVAPKWSSLRHPRGELLAWRGSRPSVAGTYYGSSSLDMDLGCMRVIAALATQGSQCEPTYGYKSSSVKSFKLFWRAEGKKDPWCSLGTFAGNVNAAANKTHVLASCEGEGIRCRHLRIVPIQVENGGALRVQLYGPVQERNRTKGMSIAAIEQTNRAMDERDNNANLSDHEDTTSRKHDDKEELIYWLPRIINRKQANKPGAIVIPTKVFATINKRKPSGVTGKPLPWQATTSGLCTWRPVIHGDKYWTSGALNIDLGRTMFVTALSTQGGPPPTRSYPRTTNRFGMWQIENGSHIACLHPGRTAGRTFWRWQQKPYTGPFWQVYEGGVRSWEESPRWVRSYELFWRARHEEEWKPLGTFAGNTDTTTERAQLFDHYEEGGIQCRYLRIVPVEVENGGALRIQIYGKPCPKTTANDLVEYKLYHAHPLQERGVRTRDGGKPARPSNVMKERERDGRRTHCDDGRNSRAPFMSPAKKKRLKRKRRRDLKERICYDI